MKRATAAIAPAEVTVVLATYNGAAFIDEQVESLCKQTLRPTLVVVTDDGSTDGTPDRAGSRLTAAGVPHVLTSNPGRRGFGENFFHGMSLARTEFIAFCDQDDVWEPNKLQICVDLLRDTDADVCAHGARLIDAQGRDIGRFTGGLSRARVLPPNTLPPWFTFFGFSLVMRRRLLALADPGARGRDFWRSHERVAHDAWVTLVGSSLGRTTYTPTPLAMYRQHGGNLIGARQESLRHRVAQALGPAASRRLNRSAIARAWARQLAKMDPASQGETHAGAAVQRWKMVAAAEMFRLRMYSAPHLLARVKFFSRALISGLYFGGRGALGLRYMPKDLVVGVLRVGGQVV